MMAMIRINVSKADIDLDEVCGCVKCIICSSIRKCERNRLWLGICSLSLNHVLASSGLSR